MSTWSPERDAQLRALWMQDAPHLSTSAIGAAMGLTKSAVVGRAHRLHLPPRPSPIAVDSRPWSAEDDAHLRDLRAAGIVAWDIGVRLGRSSNAVRSRCQELGLRAGRRPPSGARPRSHGVRTLVGRGAAVVDRARAAAAPPFLAAALPKGSQPIPDVRASGDPGPAGFPGSPEAFVSPLPGRVTGVLLPDLPLAPVAAPGVFSGRACRWPMWGDTERPTHRYCGAPVALRDDGAACVYCPGHRARGTVRPREAGEAPAHHVTRSVFNRGWPAA